MKNAKFLLLSLMLSAASVNATPINYVYSGVASGSIGQSFFSDMAFDIVTTADTENISPWLGGGVIRNINLSATIDLHGLGQYVFLTPSHTWLYGNPMGIGENLSLNWITIYDSAVLGYGLDDHFGPLLETDPLHFYQFNNVLTSGGSLSVSSIDYVTITASPVPELPVTYLMFAGFAFLGSRLRKHFMHASIAVC